MRNSDKGNMPFAMIAVTLLILAGVYGVVTTSIERSESNLNGIENELNSVGSAMSAAKEFIERGAGEVILNMSREASSGGLEERFDTFDARLNDWIDFQFPMRASGAVVNVSEHDILMSVGTLKASSDDDIFNGVRPSSFRADGDVIIKITTSSGSVERTLNISADSMSALPLLLENASLFELSITGPWSMVTELMSYQLTSLAQYRVMNGYGSISEYGERGTNAILTNADVELAYRIALSVAEATYLHTASDDEYDLTSYERADVAELIAFRDGFMEIDLGAVMAQTLIGLIDTLLLSWLDYLMLTKILDVVERITDGLKNTYDWLRNLFGKDDAETARGYISGTMSNLGIPESEYRYLLNGMIGIVNLPSVELDMSYIGNEKITIPSSRAAFDYPDVDILKWNGWNGFMSRYRSEHNEIREKISGMLNAIAIGLASSYGMGKVRIGCDPYDADGFLETVIGAVYEALEMNRTHTEDLMESTIRSEKIIDPLYASIYGRMENGMNDLFKISELEDNIHAAIKENITGYLRDKHGIPLDPSAVDSAVGEMMSSYEVVRIMADYKEIAGNR
ncbi:MAG: hypothetical protein FWG19_02800, partial [Methanomassiliicoccaceae archaeon]|nr:hypothetical protein [Methanomassiliicoccaceae archaeon]